MRRVVLLAVLAGCPDPERGASVLVDGVGIELPEVTVMQIDTFYMLSARAPDSATLELGFPTSTALGTHSCDEGRIAGLINLSFTTAAGQRYSSVYPSS